MINVITTPYADIGECLVSRLPHPDLTCVVIIPAFVEPTLQPTIASLNSGFDCAPELIEVIILINQSKEVSPEHSVANRGLMTEVAQMEDGRLLLHAVLVTDIPEKIAGVGTARKLAMDEAARRLNSVGRGHDGVIVNLDADCRVSPNYFDSILTYFKRQPKIELANIHFEHNLNEAANDIERRAIILYELHLRYFIAMQLWLGVPYAYQTIGSAFAVRGDAYLGIGGMNRRKAGEDFYFIHKFTKKGTAGNLNSCTVYPSSRPSFRVPFGTGKAVAEIMNATEPYTTYAPQSFADLVPLLNNVDRLYDNDAKRLLYELPEGLKSYLMDQDFVSVMDKLRLNAKSLPTFQKAFYQWFDAFKLMKYLHWTRDRYYPDVPPSSAILAVADDIGVGYVDDLEVLLLNMRELHKSL